MQTIYRTKELFCEFTRVQKGKNELFLQQAVFNLESYITWFLERTNYFIHFQSERIVLSTSLDTVNALESSAKLKEIHSTFKE